jgi:hypothetical protein
VPRGEIESTIRNRNTDHRPTFEFKSRQLDDAHGDARAIARRDDDDDDRAVRRTRGRTPSWVRARRRWSRETRRDDARCGDGVGGAAMRFESRARAIARARDATRARSGEDGARGAKDDLTDDAVSRNGDDDARR